jgi:hypothetical protein
VSPPEKETGRRQRPAAHHSTPTAIRVAKSDPPGKAVSGFLAKAATGKVRPEAREPGVTHYSCSCCRWSA